jgi:hypothetical protein
MTELHFGIKPEDILELAAQKLADEFADKYQISQRAYELIEARVEGISTKNLVQKIDDLLTAEMDRILKAEIIPLDMWGEKAGQPTTIRDQIAERARKFWDEKVDKDGKLTTYGGQPRHEHMMRQIVSDEFDKAIKQNVVEIIAGMKDAMRAHAHKVADEYLDKLIAVKDQRR